MYANIHPWTMPQNYAGDVWPDYYSAGVGQSRDSSTLERSNFRSMLRALGGESETVVVVREGHWAVGWVEWIAIHATDDAALAVADRIAGALRDYSVVDENDWNELELETAESWWRDMGMRERIYACVKFDVSMFAARRDEIPDDSRGELVCYLADGC